jgi:hypothetical protein
MMKYSRMTKPDVDTNNADTSAPFQGCSDTRSAVQLRSRFFCEDGKISLMNRG